MTDHVVEFIDYTACELRYLVENAPVLTTSDLIDRIIDLQGVLNVALSRLYKSTKEENEGE